MKQKSDQCCGNCSASIPDKDNEGNIFCRAHPPYVFPINKMTLTSPKPQVVMHSQFPSMLAEKGWCREWAPKEYDS